MNRDKIKKTVSLISALFFVFSGILVIRMAISSEGSIVPASIVAASLLILAYGLFRQYRWALRISAYAFLVIAIILPGGIFNPFTAGDYMAAGKPPPDVKHTLLWLVPVEALLLAAAFILSPGKKETNVTG